MGSPSPKPDAAKWLVDNPIQQRLSREKLYNI